MIQVCFDFTTESCSLGEDLASVRLSMKKYAAMTPSTARPA